MGVEERVIGGGRRPQGRERRAGATQAEIGGGRRGARGHDRAGRSGAESREEGGAGEGRALGSGAKKIWQPSAYGSRACSRVLLSSIVGLPANRRRASYLLGLMGVVCRQALMSSIVAFAPWESLPNRQHGKRVSLTRFPTTGQPGVCLPFFLWALKTKNNNERPPSIQYKNRGDEL
eukprot:Gb_21588 [translate_table: standard]